MHLQSGRVNAKIVFYAGQLWEWKLSQNNYKICLKHFFLLKIPFFLDLTLNDNVGIHQSPVSNILSILISNVVGKFPILF